MKLFAREPAQDLRPTVAELRSRVKSIEADRQKAQDQADDLAVRLAEAEAQRDKFSDIAERRRVTTEQLLAERDKTAAMMVTLREQFAAEIAEMRRQFEIERQDFQSRSRAHAEAASVVTEMKTLAVRDCQQAIGAMKNILITLGQ